MPNAAGFPTYTVTSAGGTIPINTGGADVNGNFWWYKTIKGWDSPESRVSMIPLLSQDGEIPADLHYKGRVVTLTGWVECPSENARQLARYLMTGVINLIYASGTLTVDEVPAKALTIVHSGVTTFDDCGTAIKMAQEGGALLGGLAVATKVFLADWTLEMYAQNPRKLSTTQHSQAFSGGAATWNNVGNTANGPVITLTTGGSDPITVTESVGGRQLRLHSQPGQAAMPATVVIDVNNKTIVDGFGTNRYDLRDLSTSWFALAPGVGTVNLSPGSVGGTLAWNDAWY